MTNASDETARAGPGEGGRTGPPDGRRGLAAAIAVAVRAAGRFPMSGPTRDRSVIVVLTDDQRWDTLEAMPWLRGELARDGSGWATLPLAFDHAALLPVAREPVDGGVRAPQAVVDNGSGDRLE